jgi:hypothetical protein
MDMEMDMNMKKKKDNREIISNDNDDLIKNPNVLNMVSSATPRAFAEEANVEERITHTDAAGSATSDMAIMDRSKEQQIINLQQAMPMSLKSELSRESILADQLVDTRHPGATEIFPGGVASLPPRNGTPVDDISLAQLPESTMGDSDMEANHPPEPTLNAFLVNDDSGVIASATILDIEAEEKVHQKRRRMAMLGAFLTASIITGVVAVPVLLTRPSTSIVVSLSPAPSEIPSFIPTSSPSSGLFGFLAENSFDNGTALDIPGSPQQQAINWLLNESGLVAMDYHLLQTYALVTLYIATSGNQWKSQVELENQRYYLQNQGTGLNYLLRGEWLNLTSSVNPLGFCDWQGISCNINNTEIESLSLPSDNLYGLIPAELAMLHVSLSKSIICCAEEECLFSL